jgi:hypothetical protein
MALFTIMHIYEVLAENQHEATDELALARELHAEKVFHVKTIVREAGVKPWRDNGENLKQQLRSKPRRQKPASMVTIFKRQITGNW